MDDLAAFLKRLPVVIPPDSVKIEVDNVFKKGNLSWEMFRDKFIVVNIIGNDLRYENKNSQQDQQIAITITKISGNENFSSSVDNLYEFVGMACNSVITTSKIVNDKESYLNGKEIAIQYNGMYSIYKNGICYDIYKVFDFMGWKELQDIDLETGDSIRYMKSTKYLRGEQQYPQGIFPFTDAIPFEKMIELYGLYLTCLLNTIDDLGEKTLEGKKKIYDIVYSIVKRLIK